MAQLASLNQVTLHFGDHLLFSDLTLAFSEGERTGLIGANGVGKSSLIRLVAGLERPDAGSVARRKELRFAYVTQTPQFDPSQSIAETARRTFAEKVAEGLRDEVQTACAALFGKLGFTDLERSAGTLSGGWQKRLALVLAISQKPDFLLLDEPTNHLDAEGIAWLEDWLKANRASSLIVSHDRAFLEAVATRIVELSPIYPGYLLINDGPYSRFLERRCLFEESQNTKLENLENKVRNEIDWLKRGPKARTGKDKGRQDTAHLLIDELSELKERRKGLATQIDFSASGRRSKRLLTATGLTKSLGGRVLFRELDLLLTPGIKLGILGGNGVGKTTLLKVLANEALADDGQVAVADRLQVVSFDQHRATLDPEQTLRRALCPQGDSVRYQGREVHVNGWAGRFGFKSQQLDTLVARLSGGEQAKLQIARLMLCNADVLLLDEPTNDLDLPTLDVLEQSLLDFPGALVLVTHDRFMLDRVANVILGLDGTGGHVFVADREQWEATQAKEAKNEATADGGEKPAKPREKARAKKLGYLEQREYEGMEARIAEAEEEVERINALLANPKVACDGAQVEAAYLALQTATTAADILYARWDVLESKLREIEG